MSDLLYPAVVSKIDDEDGGGYLAIALDLKGCIADGDTPEAAVAYLKEAIGEWLDEAKRLGRRIPRPGEAMAKAHHERKAIKGVITKQSELLERQEAAFKRLRTELQQLKHRIELIACEKDAEEVETSWGPVATLIAVSTTRRGGDGRFSY